MSSDTVRPKRRTVGDSGEGSAPRSRSAVSFVQLSQLVRSEGKRRYQRVLLLNPAATLFHADLPRCTYPLGIGYIAAVLERHGYEVKILDVFAAGYDRGLPLEEDSSFIRYGSPLEEVEALLRDFHPDVVGVSNIFSNQADNVHELLQLAKRTLPDVVTAVGGAHARYFPKACLEDPALDAVFLGESEFTFLRWLQHLNGAVDASELRGIACLARTPQIPGLIPLVVDVLVDEETSAPRLNGGHEGDEFIYVLEGTVNFRWVADGNEHLEVLLPGSSAILREGTSHSFTLPAGADAPAKLLAVNL